MPGCCVGGDVGPSLWSKCSLDNRDAGGNSKISPGPFP